MQESSLGKVIDYATPEKWRKRGEEFRGTGAPTTASMPLAIAHDLDAPFEFTLRYYEIDIEAMARFHGYMLVPIDEDTPPIESR